MVRLRRILISGISILSLLLGGCNTSTPENATGDIIDSVPQPTSTPGLEMKIEDLLNHHGWTIAHMLAAHTVTLPDSFQHAPGDFPYAIYWAYNNKLNRSISLDLTPYLGLTTQISIYVLNEPLPAELSPYTEARAIVVSYENEIFGAWIEKAVGFACSLDRQQIADIDSQAWREWLVSSGVVDLTDTLDLELAAKTPEEIIALYYKALNAHDAQMVNALRSRRALTYGLFINKDALSLYNLAEQASYTSWINNIESATLLSVRLLPDAPGNCLPIYEARVNFQFVDPHRPTIPEGENLRFLVLNHEVEGLGWRIEEINTAPGVSERLCES